MTTENRQDAPLPASDKQEGMEQREPLTMDEVINLRAQALQQRKPQPKEEPEPVEPEASEAQESEEEPAEPEDESMGEGGESADDVLSKFNLESMSEEELAKLGEAIRSKVPKRFGELTKRAKTAEERIAELEAKLEQERAAKENPLERPKPVENNPFKDVQTIEGLQEQWESFARIEEWADNLLDDNDHLSPDDIITEQDGRELTKKEVKQYLKKARQAREKFLPARLAELQQVEQAKHVKAALEDKAKAELDWFADTDNTTRKEYELVINDPRVKLISERVPEVAAQLDYLLAHAVNSMAGLLAKQKAPAKKQSPTLKPPSNPDSGNTRSQQGSRDQFSKELNDAKERLAQSHSWDDFAALRAKERLRKNL